ncbi:hypothetical protein AMTRI_Chr01g113550 [Amborella trichopoda]|uniref:Uncharacterized protein n=1 Tax=Amborella trichopoda TaxID=13333 RepID=W1PXI8_AMBTC|nr:uncharacterized protein LOC18440809 [Amborella trichopoda]ERN12591.1 hypothetical protein AMTR_s00025p00219060 [Amborella trichopoda]|eukprot:XP_006851010.1 uncharacterized protein LOC18440809 [Amborella trichopoda]
MALSQTAQIAIAIGTLGALSFIFGVVAENKKPASGSPIVGKDFVVCKFPYDQTVPLGALSLVCLVFSSILGLVSVYFPYQKKTVPAAILFRSTSLCVFFGIATLVSTVSFVLLMWGTITEGLHHVNKVHNDVTYACPTAKTGLFGGAAFLALDSALFWLICQMLTLNSRADYEEEDPKGDYGEVHTADYTNSNNPKV